MYIVNTSFFVDAATHDAWLDIVRGKFIPFLRSEGCAIVAFSRVLSEDYSGHFTYSIMVDVADMGEYKRYAEELLAEYERLAEAMFGEKVTTFTTIMKKM